MRVDETETRRLAGFLFQKVGPSVPSFYAGAWAQETMDANNAGELRNLQVKGASGLVFISHVSLGTSVSVSEDSGDIPSKAESAWNSKHLQLSRVSTSTQHFLVSSYL
jgi:hypothetical protein